MPPLSGRAAGGERGAGTVLVAGVMVLVLCCLAVALWLTSWLACAQRAQQAADLAALAGARAHGEQVGSAPGAECAAAKDFAARNGARLSGCTVQGGAQQFLVRVEVAVELYPKVSGGARQVLRSAVAGSLQRR